MSAKPKIRCAIYARTSTEEGLSQEFNSLDAQIEACRAYIASQAGEGWIASKQTYVDGGYSGGSLERPALQNLLAALAAREVDVIVVYKVDRLTRALSDFAKIVERMDQAGASFVSVTQAFNTTSSMGRLTLNVLLSFAQFEREVTAERIRDKVAASKAKGMWMGGTPPLGYDAQDRSLIVNQPEAERVRFIFARYLELGSIQKLAEDLDQRDVRSKGWVSRTGRVHESQRIYPGALAAILSNPIYRGLIAHRGKTYQGRHDAIVDEATWDAVQKLRSAIKSPNSALPERIDDALLRGRAFDDAGNPMRVVFTRKSERRYRYYGSAAHLDGKGTPGSLTRVSVGALDRAVIEAVALMLCDRWRAHESKQARVLAALRQVEVSAQKLRFLLATEAIAPTLQGESSVERVGDALWLTRPIALARPRNATAIIGAAPPAARTDRTLVRAIALARAWADKLESGAVRSVVDLAAAEKRCLHYTNKLLPLAYLAPDLIEMILDGRQPRALALSTLLAKPLPLDWVAQRAWLRALA